MATHVEGQAAEDAGRPRSARHLVGMPVRIGDVDVGRVIDVLFNRSVGHAFGVAVDGHGPHRHFLPWAAMGASGDHVEVRSVHALLTTTELVFYLDNGVSLEDELGRAVFDDVLVDAEGDVSEVVGDRRPAPNPSRGPLRVVR
jgi:hypothetical protein